jgi:putative tricarboxylic transport membrane protein
VTASFRRALVSVVAALAVAVGPTHAQLRTLTIIAPAAPGGGWDQTARAMQRALEDARLVSSVRVINIAGAGGTIGLAQLVNANRGRGDVLMAMGLIMVGSVLTNKAPVTLAQATPVARLTGEYEVLVVPAASPYRTLREFVAAWKADPGRLPIAGGSAGGTDHMLAGLLAIAVGLDARRVNYVPHSGGGESIATLLGGQVAAGINGLAELAPFVDAGRLRALGVSSEEQPPGVPIRTFVEQGVAVSLSNWRGVVAPPGLTRDQRDALTSLVDRLHASPAWRAALGRYRWIDMYQSGPAFDAFLDQEHGRAARVLKTIGLVR